MAKNEDFGYELNVTLKRGVLGAKAKLLDEFGEVISDLLSSERALVGAGSK